MLKNWAIKVQKVLKNFIVGIIVSKGGGKSQYPSPAEEIKLFIYDIYTV